MGIDTHFAPVYIECGYNFDSVGAIGADMLMHQPHAVGGRNFPVVVNSLDEGTGTVAHAHDRYLYFFVFHWLHL